VRGGIEHHLANDRARIEDRLVGGRRIDSRDRVVPGTPLLQLPASNQSVELSPDHVVDATAICVSP
jgi:hypothetical protein